MTATAPVTAPLVDDGTQRAIDAAPPQDVEAERSVLGAMLLDPKALPVALQLLQASDFLQPEHARVFAAVAEAHRSLEPEEQLDLVILEGFMRATGDLEELGGRAFLVDLVDSCPTTSNVRYHCETVRRLAAQRAAFDAGLELARNAARPGADPVGVLAGAQASLKRIVSRAKSAAPKSLRRLMADCPEMRPPAVKGLLRVGETANTIAPTKTGKSWLVIDLALNVVTGGQFLGMYPCQKGNVLILDNELHDETIANRIPRVAEALGISLADVADHLFTENLRGRLMDIYGLQAYLANVQPGRYLVIVLDAFYRFLPRGTDENSNADIAAMYNVVDAIAERLGCCFVLIHHSSKGSQSLKVVTDVGSGAGAQSRASDTHLILRAHEEDDVFVLNAAARSWPPIKPVCLRWEFPVFRPAPDLDPLLLKPDRPRRPRKVKEPKPPVKTWTMTEFVADFVSSKPKSRATILEAAHTEGMSERRGKQLLTAAEDAGSVFRWQHGPAKTMQFATVKQPTLEENS